MKKAELETLVGELLKDFKEINRENLDLEAKVEALEARNMALQNTIEELRGHNLWGKYEEATEKVRALEAHIFNCIEPYEDRIRKLEKALADMCIANK